MHGKASECAAWADHQVIDKLALRLAENWSSEAKDRSSILTGVT